MGCYDVVQRGGAPSPLLLAVPNVTAHPSTASLPITVLFCGFNVSIKGFIRIRIRGLIRIRIRRLPDRSQNVKI